MNLITIIGARPQFVKAAAVSRALRAYPHISEKIVHTGQHFDPNMSAIFFQEMDLPNPHYHLNINDLPPGAMIGRMLEKVEEILLIERPDAVLVYGDTNTTLAGALAARKQHIPVMHVEAGIRSHNPLMAEEINRILTDRVSDVLFCPTTTAIQNLEKEGFAHFSTDIRLVGDVMEDALLHFGKQPNATDKILKDMGLYKKPFVLCTLHRAENTQDLSRLMAIVEALNAIAAQIPVVLPLHPRTRQVLAEHSLELRAKVLPPLGYPDFLGLMQAAQVVMTDSGGIQKEAYFLGKFCLTLRDDTEWPELVVAGYNYLVGANKALILSTLQQVLSVPFPDKNISFGEGKAAQKIAAFIALFSSKSSTAS